MRSRRGEAVTFGSVVQNLSVNPLQTRRVKVGEAYGNRTRFLRNVSGQVFTGRHRVKPRPFVSGPVMTGHPIRGLRRKIRRSESLVSCASTRRVNKYTVRTSRVRRTSRRGMRGVIRDAHFLRPEYEIPKGTRAASAMQIKRTASRGIRELLTSSARRGVRVGAASAVRAQTKKRWKT